jgi:hypothetical protein
MKLVKPLDYELPEVRVAVTKDLMSALIDALQQELWFKDSRIELEALLLQLRLVDRASMRTANGGW